MPKEKRVQNALTWISENKGCQDTDQELIQKAVFRFNLTPKEEEYLYHLFLSKHESD
jgi:hypothetical protein